MKTSICQQCFKVFTITPGSYGKFCSLSCGTIFRNINKLEKIKSIYNSNPKKCSGCSSALSYEKRKNRYCSVSCAAKITNQIPRKRGPDPKEKPQYCSVKFFFCNATNQWYSNRNTDGSFRRASPYTKNDKEKYYNAARFRFNVYHYPEEFDIQLIESAGWYTCPGKKRKNKTKNIGGVSRDHIISISYGYKHNIDPSIISHPANCRIILHSRNKEKADKCELSLDQLLIRIQEWNRKYTERMTGFEPATNSLEG